MNWTDALVQLRANKRLRRDAWGVDPMRGFISMESPDYPLDANGSRPIGTRINKWYYDRYWPWGARKADADATDWSVVAGMPPTVSGTVIVPPSMASLGSAGATSSGTTSSGTTSSGTTTSGGSSTSSSTSSTGSSGTSSGTAGSSSGVVGGGTVSSGTGG